MPDVATACAFVSPLQRESRLSTRQRSAFDAERPIQSLRLANGTSQFAPNSLITQAKLIQPRQRAGLRMSPASPAPWRRSFQLRRAGRPHGALFERAPGGDHSRREPRGSGARSKRNTFSWIQDAWWRPLAVGYYMSPSCRAGGLLAELKH